MFFNKEDKNMLKKIDAIYDGVAFNSNLEILLNQISGASNSYTYTHSGDKAKILLVAYGGSSNSGSANISITTTGKVLTRSDVGSGQRSCVYVIDVEDGHTTSISISISLNYNQSLITLVKL